MTTIAKARSTILEHVIFSDILTAAPFAITEGPDSGYKAPFDYTGFQQATEVHKVYESANIMWILDVLRCVSSTPVNMSKVKWLQDHFSMSRQPSSPLCWLVPCGARRIPAAQRAAFSS